MIKNLSINDCLISLEGVLNLEYDADISTAKLLKKTVESLENRYGVTIDKSVYDIQNETQLSANSMNQFITAVSTALQRLALYNHMLFYTKKIPFDLAEANYLRYAQDEMLSYLSYLIDEDSKEIQYAETHGIGSCPTNAQ